MNTNQKQEKHVGNIGQDAIVTIDDARTKLLAFAHTHTIEKTNKFITDNDLDLDEIMYNELGRPKCYDEWSGECAGIRCTNGIIWN